MYKPTMTPGRELYEQWLFYRDVSPDDLWDHLDPETQTAWERLTDALKASTPSVTHPHPCYSEPLRAARRLIDLSDEQQHQNQQDIALAELRSALRALLQWSEQQEDIALRGSRILSAVGSW